MSKNIDYRYRPYKATERYMICDSLKRLAIITSLKKFQYIGFGALHFVDFKLFYKYLGISELGFYPKKSTGRWFSGTLVFGDDTELDESDKKWMLRDEMYFRIKVVKDSKGKLQWKAYYLDYPEVSLDLL